MGAVIRAFDAKIDDIDQANRTMVVRFNTNEVDRYRSVIEPLGGRFENYRRNPIFLWEHGKDPRRHTDPIGRSLWVKPSKADVIGKKQFLTDDFSQQRYEWYRDGVLNAVSLSVIPDLERCSAPTREEVRSRPDLERCDIMYRSWDLSEVSGTACPGNVSCMVAGRAAQLLSYVERGLWLPDDVQAELRTMTESVGGLHHGGAVVKPKWEGEEKPKREATGERYVDADEDGYVVVEADGSVVHPRFATQALAEQLLRMLAQPPRDFAALSVEIMSPLMARSEAFLSHIEARIDLQRNWRV